MHAPVVAAVAAVLLVAAIAVGAVIALHPGASQNGAGSPGATSSGSASDDTPAANASARALDISVQQVDASDFPHVKVYLSIEDPATGEVPEKLDSKLFYLKREDANANYVQQRVSAVNQLNGEEALKVDLVADVSGSMDGQPIADAKSVMSDFVDSMQFDAGDEAELTSFATGVRLEQEFTDDASLLKRKINAFATSDQTSLYDALYTAVERVAAQQGARCVIAFTDGADNNSSCTLSDVADAATRYRVPVFTIGIGSSDYSDVAQLAEQTGGRYYSIDDTVSMDEVYQEIYRNEKELYLLEYDDTSDRDASEPSNIRVGYVGGDNDYRGECSYSYTPYILMNVKNDATLYTTGPQAAVEGYLKNWAPAVTNSDYSRIAPYILQGSSLYDMQTDFVRQSIDEQLDSYEITDTSYSDSTHATVSTRETFYVQYQGQNLQLVTQVVTYSVEEVDGQWLMTDILSLETPVRIDQ